MKNAKIVSVWGWQTNPFYNPETSSNGGGYFQFKGGAVLELNGKTVIVTVEDASCGDFGSRIYATIESESHNWLFGWGTMDDASLSSEEEFYASINSASAILGVDANELLNEIFSNAEFLAWESL